MKIALLGYGRMGKAIELIAKKRGHEIIAKIDIEKSGNIKNADIAINFSTPSTAVKNIKNAIINSIPVVSGTTGWMKDYNKIEKLALNSGVGFLYSPNFSISVNLFFELNKSLAKLMKSEKYSTEVNEKHHFQKVDSPSGTSISLANDIISNSNYKKWSLEKTGNNILKISSSREGDIHGIHEVIYNSEFDKISINHESYSRVSYATGAVIAAEWLMGRIGVYSMSDLLNSK